MTGYDVMAALHCLIALMVTWFPVTSGNPDAKRLYDDLMRKSNYNKLIRPARNSTQKMTVKLGLRLSQLINVDEKNEIISTNMWVIQEWQDNSLRWDPEEYGEVRAIYVPSESIWLPDIVLYNNADGDYTVTLMTKATLTYHGAVRWQPPVIFKSQCDMNMEFFPFDQQLCRLKFGSWTYDGNLVDLRHVDIESLNLNETDIVEDGIDLKNYYPSAEWDILGVPARKNIVHYPCCSEPYPDITFNITLRRKTLYFTYNLILPCVSINMLTLLTFYLPSDSGEKISLCISILLSLSVFQLLLMDLIPTTSFTVPLIGKYILFTMALVSLSVFVSVMTLNKRFRSSSTHKLPALTRRLFLEVLPCLLFMKRPEIKDEDEVDTPEFVSEFSPDLVLDPHGEGTIDIPAPEPDVESLFSDYDISSTFIGAQSSQFAASNLNSFCRACAQRKSRMTVFPYMAQKALKGCIYVAKHHQEERNNNKVGDDWRYMALVIDRLFLYIYISVCCAGIFGILLNAPVLYDSMEALHGFENSNI